MKEKILLFFQANKIIAFTSTLSLVFMLFLVSQHIPKQTDYSISDEPVRNSKVLAEEEDSLKQQEKIIKEQGITVDIKGAVAKPGVYQLNEEERVVDAIEKAGGFVEGANQNVINMAKKLSDEELIYIPTINESDLQFSDNPSSSETNQKLNLNKATVSDLQTISGIGAKRAQDIIDYRESKGGFQSIEELKEISGIGQKTFEKLEESLDV